MAQRQRQRQWTRETRAGLRQRQQTALSSLQIQSLGNTVPCNPISTSYLQETPATECLQARGKQVLICYLCEKPQLNEGFTSSYDQSWRGTWWLTILLMASGYHYVMADPFLLAAVFSNTALINKMRKRERNMELYSNGLSSLRINWSNVIWAPRLLLLVVPRGADYYTIVLFVKRSSDIISSARPGDFFGLVASEFFQCVVALTPY